MWQRREVSLSEAQRAELETLRDHDPRPYVREKAAGILKVADGAPIFWVADYGLLQVRHRQTVSEWIAR